MDTVDSSESYVMPSENVLGGNSSQTTLVIRPGDASANKNSSNRGAASNFLNAANRSRLAEFEYDVDDDEFNLETASEPVTNRSRLTGSKSEEDLQRARDARRSVPDVVRKSMSDDKVALGVSGLTSRGLETDQTHDTLATQASENKQTCTCSHVSSGVYLRTNLCVFITTAFMVTFFFVQRGRRKR